MSANDATNRSEFAIGLGSYDPDNSADEGLRRFLAGVHSELEETALPILHPKIRNAAITVGQDDVDVIYGLVRHALKLITESKTVPGRLSRFRLELLNDALSIAVGAFEDPHCRECGCTDMDACAEGCWWVAEDLCSNCAPARKKEGTEK